MANRLTMTRITKRFGSTQALAGVDLELQDGEIHALVGENGAGKSTLMKVLSGAVVPDSGSMVLEGTPFVPRGPDDARRLGVAMVYQESTLAPHLSVEANIMLGLEAQRWGWLDRTANRRRALEVLGTLQHPEIHPDSPVRGLSPAAQQVVEIARALLIDARIVVLDEPTSALNQHDARQLFTILRRLKERGVSVVYISHFLEEVQEIADRVSVLRDGRRVATGPAADFRRERIISLMVGRDLTEQYPRVPHEIGEAILDVTDLAGMDLPRRASLTLHRGEILGLFGVVGAGRTELLRTLFGLQAVRHGQVKIRGVLDNAADPRRRIREGFGLLSEDRKDEGLALGQSIADNLTYSKLDAYTRLGALGWLNLRARAEAVAAWVAKLGVRCAGPEQPVGALSGGNQQKIALGRLLHQHADILLLDEPTRGVDVGSKADIYRLIGDLAGHGKAILFVSSYLPELLGICDRLAVMTRGRLGVIRPTQEWTPEQVMAAATAEQ